MQIDWFTTGAQIINFLILVWLLKKFLYRPILTAMETREQNLVLQREALARQQAETEQLKKNYDNNLHHLNIEKANILSEARQQAESDRAEQLLKLAEEIRDKKNRFAEEMHKEQQEFGAALGKVIADKALQMSSKILSELADKALEQQIIGHFLRHLEVLPDDEQALLHKAVAQDGSVRIITRFPLDESMRQAIRSELDNLAIVSDILYEQSAHLVCGIALEAGGRSWEWNIDRYLKKLETDLLVPLNQQL